MTIEELRKRFPGAVLETWHQHPTGGGWVQTTAKVETTAYVGPDAWVSGNARVYGNAQVYGDAWVSGNAQVYGNAWVYGNARVSGNAQVSGNAWATSPLQIQGSVHFVNECKKGWLKIGCIEKPLEWWKENRVRCREENGYTPEQIEEYGWYIELYAKLLAQKKGKNG